jgi:hypothetical protein
MRTTVTLDSDVEALIATAMRERGVSFKTALNEAVRAGLRPKPRAAFKQRTFALGWRPEVNYDKALQIAASVEDHKRSAPSTVTLRVSQD